MCISHKKDAGSFACLHADRYFVRQPKTAQDGTIRGKYTQKI